MGQSVRESHTSCPVRHRSFARKDITTSRQLGDRISDFCPPLRHPASSCDRACLRLQGIWHGGATVGCWSGSKEAATPSPAGHSSLWPFGDPQTAPPPRISASLPRLFRPLILSWLKCLFSPTLNDELCSMPSLITANVRLYRLLSLSRPIFHTGLSKMTTYLKYVRNVCGVYITIAVYLLVTP